MAEAPATWAVVVARAGPSAKTRLAPALSVAQRQRLALAMLADVLDACLRASLAGVLAIVDTPAARTLARAHGAVAEIEPLRVGMNGAAAAGVRLAAERGGRTVVILPGDVPLISPADVHALIAAAGSAARAVVVGGSDDGQGTNALLLRPPDVIAPAFGPPSARRHVQAGLAAGAHSLLRARLGLALDVDTPADLRRLRARGPGGATGALLRDLPWPAADDDGRSDDTRAGVRQGPARAPRPGAA